MTIQLNYILHGDLPEAGTISTCLVHEQPVTIKMIQELFPYDGIYHFRIKRPIYDNNEIGTEYRWMDIYSTSTEHIQPINNIIEIQALVLYLPSPVDDEQENNANEYEQRPTTVILQEMNEIYNEIGLNVQNRPNRQVIEAENIIVGDGMEDQSSFAATALNLAQGLQNITLSSVTKNAINIWSTVKSTATQFGMQLNTPIDNLNKIYTHFTTSYDDSIQRHVVVLQELWYALFPGYPFERESPKWREAGWQKPDPTIDIKNTGMLALRCMRYLGQTYPDETQRMVTSQRENIKTHYPFAVVGINITLLLVDILGIKEKRYALQEHATSGYYDMFEDRRAFYELFCLSFLYMDHIWVSRNSVRADFGKLIGEVKGIVSEVMNMKPQSIQEFRQLANEKNFIVN